MERQNNQYYFVVKKLLSKNLIKTIFILFDKIQYELYRYYDILYYLL